MKILLVHNAYGRFSGEEAVVEGICSLLRSHGHDVIPFFRSSQEIANMPFGKVRAFFSGVYSFSSMKAMRKLLLGKRPDVVHIHNVFPLISPSILGECRKAGVPVVMTLHNYRLACPRGLHMIDGKICEKCRGGKEYWCVLRNCEDNLCKSFGYALRGYLGRRLRSFSDNVAVYTTMTEFHKERLISEGVPPERICVLTNMVSVNGQANSCATGEYIAFAGRVSREKGLDVLLAAAQKCRHVPFRIAGNHERMAQIVQAVPSNCSFLGHLTGSELQQFYKAARIVVVPSLCFETFGLTVAEAMAWGKPTICSAIGALTEIVDDGITGLLFEPGNVDDLADKIQYLWARPDACMQMGKAGRQKALREYSPEKYYERLMAVYRKAIELGPPRG